MEQERFSSLDKIIKMGCNVKSLCKFDKRTEVDTFVTKYNKKTKKEEILEFANGRGLLNSLAFISNNKNHKELMQDINLDSFLGNGCVINFSKFDEDKIKVTLSWGGEVFKDMLVDTVDKGIVMLEEELCDKKVTDFVDVEDIYASQFIGEWKSGARRR